MISAGNIFSFGEDSVEGELYFTAGESSESGEEDYFEEALSLSADDPETRSVIADDLHKKELSRCVTKSVHVDSGRSGMGGLRMPSPEDDRIQWNPVQACLPYDVDDSWEVSYLDHLKLILSSAVGGTAGENVRCADDQKVPGGVSNVIPNADRTSQKRREASHNHLSQSSATVLKSIKSGSRKDSQPSSRKHQEVTQVIRWFGHGKFQTILAVLFACTGVILSCFSRTSLVFVHLREPIYIGRIYNPIDAFGLVNVELCFNESFSDQSGCRKVVMQSNEIDDIMLELARLFGASSTVFGAFFAFFLATAVFWETIDLRPLGFGLLMTYFLQSFTMLFFDSNLCRSYGCNAGAGCFLSIAASFCWVAACLATAKMEAFKIRATRQRLRRSRRRAKRAFLAAQQRVSPLKIPFQSVQSIFTQNTTDISSSASWVDLEDPNTRAMDRAGF